MTKPSRPCKPPALAREAELLQPRVRTVELHGHSRSPTLADASRVMAVQLVTIEGSIGTGKSTLANHVAQYMPSLTFFAAPEPEDNPGRPASQSVSERLSTLAVVQVSERGKASYDANGKQQLLFTKPPPPTARGATTRSRGVRVVSTGATGLASRRTPHLLVVSALRVKGVNGAWPSC